MNSAMAMDLEFAKMADLRGKTERERRSFDFFLALLVLGFFLIS